MKKLFKKTIAFLLLCSIIISVNSNSLTIFAEEDFYEMEFNTNMVSAEDWEGLPIGEYPINLDSPEWDDMYVTEKIAACDMPQAYAESLTTEELAKYAVNYPLMVVCLIPWKMEWRLFQKML